jgi:hypothetical protein
MTTSDTISKLTTILNKCKIHYYPIDSASSLQKIYELFKSDTIFEPITGLECNYLGLYYKRVKKDYIKTEFFLLKSVEKGFPLALINVAIFYKEINANYVTSEKYYLKAFKALESSKDQSRESVIIGLADLYKSSANHLKLMELCIKYQNVLGRDTILDALLDVWNKQLDLFQGIKLVELLQKFPFQPEDEIPTSMRLYGDLLRAQYRIN